MSKMWWIRGWAALWMTLAMLSSCTPSIAPYQRKQRRFDAGKYAQATSAQTGSLYRQGQGGFLEDERARMVGDVVVIVIDEADQATRDSSTKVERASALTASAPSTLGLLNKLPSSVNPASLLSATSTNNFEGKGKVERGGRLVAILPVRVQEILPNGDFYVEGTKVIMVNDEEQHLYISGVVRQKDIADDNTVFSSRVADAEIEYFGKGTLSDNQRQGWLSRLFNKVWPF
jgi:flagellar L-ring protein precursor FlgH